MAERGSLPGNSLPERKISTAELTAPHYRNAKVLRGILDAAHITVPCQIARIPDYKNVSQTRIKNVFGRSP